ncbi:MAG TPA: DMT family transporter [Bacteroidales bacterium]|nr:DMT family transporter [Bacteroidales bacterium]
MSLQTFKVYLFAVLSMLFWGLSFVWFKIVVKWYEPITIIFLRLIISGSLMMVFMLLTRSWQTIKRKHLKYFLLLAFAQPFCYFLGESFGLTLVSSTIASVIIATIPLFSPFAGYFLVREKVTVPVVLGIVFSFLGIILMLINPDFSLNASPKGVLLLFLAVFAAVAYSVIIRKISHEYNPVTIITNQNLIGAVYFLPLFLVFDFQHFITVTPTRELIMALLQLSVFASTLAYVFYIIAIKGIGVIKANVFANLIPVFTGFFSFLILGETFTALKIAGMLLVLFGVVVSQSGRLVQLMLRTKQSKILMNRVK